jgi:hypothetical protein
MRASIIVLAVLVAIPQVACVLQTADSQTGSTGQVQPAGIGNTEHVETASSAQPHREKVSTVKAEYYGP